MVRPPPFSIAANPYQGVMRLELAPQGLAVFWEKSGRQDFYPFAAMRKLHLRRDAPAVAFIDVHMADNSWLRIPERHSPKWGRPREHRTAQYTAFVRALLSAAATARPDLQVMVGSTAAYGAGCFIAALTTLLLVGLLIALFKGTSPALVAVILLPAMYWLASVYLRQGRTRTVSPSAVPKYFLLE